MRLKDKVALVTGADSGIGQAIAAAFAREGADVAITYHTDEDGAKATREMIVSAGRRALIVHLDVTDPDAVDRCFAQVAAELAPPDILVNNAGKGMGAKMPVGEMDTALADLVIRTNLLGPLWCARAFVRGRRGAATGGRVINVSSVAEHLPTPGSAPYGMSKAGLGSLTRSLSIELAPMGINVMGIAPGMIATPMTQDRLDDPAKRAASFEEIPLHRAGRPEEIAALAVFLASADADYATGQTWTMDGGLTMNWGGA